MVPPCVNKSKRWKSRSMLVTHVHFVAKYAEVPIAFVSYIFNLRFDHL
jgi:hypothetical protein